MSASALAALDHDAPALEKHLARLVEIPGISAPAFPAREVRRSAEAVAETLLEFAFANVQLLETGGHPAVYGEHFVSADAPTVLIYGHHDVQPPGREEGWLSEPFHAEIRDGRMFGRGTADDKGGFLAYAAAVHACAANGGLPCNIKILVEGEEEIGSPHLGELIDRQRDLFGSDFIVLCDTPNFAGGVPALTYRLRGNCIIDVEVRCLDRPVHSGQAGGLAPDAAMILCSLLARLQHDDGTLAVPALCSRVRIDDAQRAAMHALPFDHDPIRRRLGITDGVRLSAKGWEDVWARPSLAITALEAIPMDRAANQITDRARARLSLRTVPDLDSQEAGALIGDALRSRVPGNAQVTVTVHGGPAWWQADPTHPLFRAARRALTRGFGAEAVMIGSGGSIGFVRPFADLAGDLPPLLTGVQDPQSNAHSENESLSLDDWRKAMRSAVHLLDELAEYGHDTHSQQR